MNTWICDYCSGIIERPEDGLVEWINSVDISAPGRNIRLVHGFRDGSYEKCTFDQHIEYKKDLGTIADGELISFLGTDGLMRLLAMVSKSELPIPETLEMIKRLHIPDYEHARKHFRAAVSAGVFEPDMPENFYSHAHILATLQYAKKS